MVKIDAKIDAEKVLIGREWPRRIVGIGKDIAEPFVYSEVEADVAIGKDLVWIAGSLIVAGKIQIVPDSPFGTSKDLASIIESLQNVINDHARRIDELQKQVSVLFNALNSRP